MKRLLYLTTIATSKLFCLFASNGTQYCQVNRGCYMPSRGYDFYLVFNSASHSFAALTSGHLIFCLFHKHTNYDIFDGFRRFATTFRRFLKILLNSENQTTILNISRTFPKIFEHCRRLPKMTKKSEDVSIRH